MYKKVGQIEKDIIVQKLSDAMEDKSNAIFAYIFGSFCNQESFQDIDIGVFVSVSAPDPVLHIEIDMERELEKLIRIPVDVRILNGAPLFVYQVIKGGIIILDKNKDLRADFEGMTFKKYFDYRHLRNEYLREVANAPV